MTYNTTVNNTELNGYDKNMNLKDMFKNKLAKLGNQGFQMAQIDVYNYIMDKIKKGKNIKNAKTKEDVKGIGNYKFYLIKTLRKGNRTMLKMKTDKVNKMALVIGMTGVKLQKFLKAGYTGNSTNLVIDHKVAISKAKTVEEIFELNKYTNLQYMDAKENLAKSDK